MAQNMMLIINSNDTIKLNTSLFLILLEYAKEHALTDYDLHLIAQNALELSSSGKTLEIKDYHKIVPKHTT